MSDEYGHDQAKAASDGYEDAYGEGPYDGPVKTSGLAIWSLILSIPPLCLPQLIAIPMGIVALVKINGSGGRLGGQGFAIAGLIVCGVQVLLTPFCVSVVAAVAIPGMLRSRIGTNESAAIGTLRSLTTAQEQFKQQAVVDLDGDGMGEYGTLTELAGSRDVRGPQGKMNTSPFIAAILGVQDGRGLSQKSGYYFVLYLPTANGPAVNEPNTGLQATPADADVQEVRWCAYAWPVAAGQSGNRAFFVNQSGDVYASPNTVVRYSGTRRIPVPEAAFDTTGLAPENLDAGVGLAAAGLQAGDGNVWVPAGS